MKPKVFFNWNERTTLSFDEGLKGKACDDLLLETCRRAGCPLITNEGYTVEGIVEGDARKLRAKAKAAGVRVYTPREFWLGRMNPKRAARRLLERVDVAAEKHLGRSTAQARENFGGVRGCLRYVLFGITSDPQHRLAVEPFGSGTVIRP